MANRYQPTPQAWTCRPLHPGSPVASGVRSGTRRPGCRRPAADGTVASRKSGCSMQSNGRQSKRAGGTFTRSRNFSATQTPVQRWSPPTTISMTVVSGRDAKRRGLKRTSRCSGWAISSSQPHCERFHQSSDCHDLAEVTLHSIGMLGCVSAHHADR